MASLTAFLVSDILQIISDYRGESNVNSNANRIRAVSRAERSLARRKFFRIHLVKDQSIGTGDGTTSSFSIGSTTYPMRMKGLAEIFVGGTTEDKRITVVDFTQYKNGVNQNANARLAYEWFDQANNAWKVKINPVPSNGDAITASWFYLPPVRTATTDYVVCEDPNIIAYLAAADIYQGEDEKQSKQLALKDAEDLIGSLMGIEEAPAVGQVYQVAPIESTTRPRGIGSY